MQAVVVHAAGDLRIDDVPPPPDVLVSGEVRVSIERGGICGSDLHYYHDGGFGTVRIKEPMILGHEVSGVVDAIGPGVTSVNEGDRVAVSPSRPCGRCSYCQKGLQAHCVDMRFFGSAMRMPHVQGAFCEMVVVPEAQCFKVLGSLTAAEAAMAEPLSVALHAVNRAGALVGKRVLVTGAGPIGALVAVAARRAGAVEIVATDIAPLPLKMMERIGADATLDMSSEGSPLKPYAAGKGYFDVLFEASGNAAALSAALQTLVPRGIVVQVGLGGDVSLPMTTLVAKELDLRGTFRFHEEFGTAVELMNRGLIDVQPLITQTLPSRRAKEAFDLASDRTRAMKVHLAFL